MKQDDKRRLEWIEVFFILAALAFAVGCSFGGSQVVAGGINPVDILDYPGMPVQHDLVGVLAGIACILAGGFLGIFFSITAYRGN